MEKFGETDKDGANSVYAGGLWIRTPYDAEIQRWPHPVIDLGPSVVRAASTIRVLHPRARIARARRNAASEGTSLSLTYLLVRTEQCLKRLMQLANVLSTHGNQPDERLAMVDRWARLTHDLVQGENRRHSVREPFSRLTGLLALRVTENAKRTGEHYIAADRTEYAAMWRSAAGGGFIVAFMALIKLLLGKFIFAPLVYVVMYSLNYSLGFVLIHILHFTLATKQPAMTAPAMKSARA